MREWKSPNAMAYHVCIINTTVLTCNMIYSKKHRNTPAHDIHGPRERMVEHAIKEEDEEGQQPDS